MTLVEALITNGLLQFGQFQINGTTQPFTVRLDLLASYPDVLRFVRDQFLRCATPVPFDRILCPLDALPIAIAVSLELQIPVVYSRGNSESTVFDLVGAYDIGHPTLIIANHADANLMKLIAQAACVGLQLSVVWTVIELASAMASDIDTLCLVRLRTILDDPFVQSWVAPGQIDAVKAWLLSK